MAASAVALAAYAPAYGQNAHASATAARVTLTTPAPAVTPRGGRPLMSPAYGDIEAFYGDIEAFYGDINPFYGDIQAFYGDINPFYGDINAFAGSVTPSYGDIQAFWGDINPFTSSTNASAPAYSLVGQYWHNSGPALNDLNLKLDRLGLTYLLDSADYNAAAAALNSIVDQSAGVWGAAVTARTGKSFRAGFADALFAKYGVNLGNPASLQGLTRDARARMILDWYDGLMDYTGADHIDWWMGVVHWTPSLTKIQGMGSSSVIGLLDSSVANDPDVANNLTFTSGYTNPLNGHGTSVASLMVADHDGRGVMGIAPRASVVSYNPFDSTGTSSFQDARQGIIALKGAGASMINMSLGVSGWTLHPDWQTVFAGVSDATLKNTVFVVAAGNSGTTQSANVPWNFTSKPALLVVGSVNPMGQISTFSNRPGTACLLDNGQCAEANRLYNSFIVAPGEMILASDGQGGLMRRSGTSFAAPLVTGAVALLHDRWPWLANYPTETVDIILRSAKDLGAPGPDPVYGRGLLDVRASQSPLNYNALTYYEVVGGVATQRTAEQVRTAGLKTTWEADNAYFTLYETIGATKRDFQVPMSSHLVGQMTTSMGGAQDYFQSYLRSQLAGWISGTAFSDVATNATQQPGQWGFAVSASLPQPAIGSHDLVQAPHVAMRMTSPSGRLAINAGHGQGAMVLDGMPAFGMTRDYGAQGGVNPVLGLASGGAFASVDFGLTATTTLSIGATERTLEHARNPDITEIQRNLLRNVDDYQAGAIDLRLTQRVGDRLTLTAGYSSVSEASGLLGVQSTERSDLRRGAQSRVANVGMNLALPQGFGLAASASTSRSHSRDGEDQNLRSVGDVQGSAYAVAFTKQGLMGRNDLLKFSFAQPLHVDSGRLAYDSVEVVDRQTGRIGVVTQTFDIATPRRYVAETLYATPVMDGQGELRLFGRAQFQSGQPATDYLGGAAFKVRF